jgi:hypothetical protein
VQIQKKHAGLPLQNRQNVPIKHEQQMSELEKLLAWGDLPVPEALLQLPQQQQQEVAAWAINIISNKTEGLDDLYNAISMIVKYIPNFMVVPLMVEHIRPRIAAEVCIKMGVDQATGYANDLPLEYFSAVSKHLDATMMAQILEKMKKNTVEKFIHYELKNHQSRVLDIAIHLDRRILQIVAKLVTLPEPSEPPEPSTDPDNNPHGAVIEKIRAMQ